VPYVNKHEVSGLIVEPGSPDSLSFEINKLLNDRDLREKYGSGARSRVQEEFAAKKVIEKTRKVYERVMSKG
ncbi:hypothetical protein KKB18_10395, partial [bacterium]|nr:hypothetical protein [bacterium]